MSKYLTLPVGENSAFPFRDSDFPLAPTDNKYENDEICLTRAHNDLIAIRKEAAELRVALEYIRDLTYDEGELAVDRAIFTLKALAKKKGE